MNEVHEHTYKGGQRSYPDLDAGQVFSAAERVMRDDKPYLDCRMSLDSLAELLGVGRNMLSQAVNQYAGVNFKVYLGRYRIAEAERLAADPDNSALRISELAKQVGFASRTSFYRMFRRVKNSSPYALLRKNEQSGNRAERRQTQRN